jgi:small neutral amino acid transporter SnatA (MarC family)
MTAERPSDDIKTLWRNQKTGDAPVTLDDIRRRAEKFQARIRSRNQREYIAAAIVVLVFGWYILIIPGWTIKTGSALCIAAALYISWQLHRRAASATPPQDATNLLDFHRRELVRQRDALKSVWLWYLAPPLPGMILILLGRYFEFHARRRSIAWDHQVIILCAIIVFLVFGLVWLLNALGAEKLQRRIDELDRLRVE